MPASHGPVPGRQPSEQMPCRTVSHLVKSWPHALAARGKSRGAAKNGDCHQFTPRHDLRNKALGLKRISWPCPIFRDPCFYHGLVVVFSVLLFLVCTVAPVCAQDESPDDLMYDRVIRKLVNDRQLKTNALEVSVKDAVVTVSGDVENEKLRRRVEKVVKKVKGVKAVVNNVRARN